MKIDSSQIMMGSRQVMMETTSMRESYEKTLIGGNSSANAGLGSFAGTLRATQTSMSQNSAREEDPIATIRQKSIMFLLDILFAARRGRSDRAFRNSLENQFTPMALENVHYEQEFTYVQQHQAAFQTTGTVMTADGRQIDFNMNVFMSSRFEESFIQSYDFTQAVQLCDPLVITLEGDIASVSDQTFVFDLDADGQKEEIHKLSAGSGYLALDKNNDGVINDGNELFGTSSGNGFADLAKYDHDKNGWIDENDAIFDDLKIWVNDEQGNQKLYTLKEKGVGAICLHNMPTYVPSYDKNGEIDAVVRSTGVFLFENGQAGSVQHLDMAL